MKGIRLLIVIVMLLGGVYGTIYCIGNYTSIGSVDCKKAANIMEDYPLIKNSSPTCTNIHRGIKLTNFGLRFVPIIFDIDKSLSGFVNDMIGWIGNPKLVKINWKVTEVRGGTFSPRAVYTVTINKLEQSIIIEDSSK